MKPTAFSLIELSIVLVILGLLTGGILAGRSLIRASELRAVSVEYARYTTAFAAFRDKYFALPGDISNATAFWGIATTCPGYLAADVRTDARTCNGNGNGQIMNNPGTNELFGMWQHLANAGLIEGQYSGITSNPAYGAFYGISFTPGVNSPVSKLGSNVTWGVSFVGSVDMTSASYVEGYYGNALHLGMGNPNTIPTAALGSGSPLKPEEAWNIDSKIDDGMAGTGKVVAGEGPANILCYLLADNTTGTTSTSVARTDVKYNLANNNAGCALIFKNVM